MSSQSESPVKYKSCCTGFGVLIDVAGTRGFGLVVTHQKDRNEIRCYLQARSFDTEADYRWLAASAEREWQRQRDELPSGEPRRVPVTLQMAMKVSYCPFCGARIADTVKRD